MTAANIVKNLLESDLYGPPAPDNFLNALGTSRHLRGLEAKRAKLMIQLERSLGIERQLRKAGVTKDQVSSYIRADQKYPEKYPMRGYGRFDTVPDPENEGQFIRRRQQPPWPADAIVGMTLEDGREILFDMPVYVDQVSADEV